LGEQINVAEELRARVGVFVGEHVDLWVEGQDEGILTLGAPDPAAVFAAVADWLREEPQCTVQDVLGNAGRPNPPTRYGYSWPAWPTWSPRHTAKGMVAEAQQEGRRGA
jgi:hypothetical protein